MFLESLTDSLLASPAGSSLLLLAESPSASRPSGSLALFRHFLLSLLQQLQPKRGSSAASQAQLLLGCFSGTVYEAQELFWPSGRSPSAPSPSNFTLIDGFSDPLRFGSFAASSDSPSAPQTAAASPFRRVSAAESLQSLGRLLLFFKKQVHSLRSSSSSSSSPHVFLFLTGLSPLFLSHSPSAVLSFLSRLKEIPNCTLLVHLDLAIVSSLSPLDFQRFKSSSATYLEAAGFVTQKLTAAASSLSLSPSAAAPSSLNVLFTVCISHVRSSGKRVSKVEVWELFSDLLLRSKKMGNEDEEDEAQRTLNKLMLPKGDEEERKPLPAAALESTFSMSLTEKEREARKKIQYPFAPVHAAVPAASASRIHVGAGGLSLGEADDEEEDVWEDEEEIESEGELDDDLDI